MLKSKRKLINIRWLPMAHLVIKIETINNFHVALDSRCAQSLIDKQSKRSLIFFCKREWCVFA